MSDTLATIEQEASALTRAAERACKDPIVVLPTPAHQSGALIALISIVKWPLFGALFAAGAFVVAGRFGAKTAHDIAKQAGEGAAEGLSEKLPLAAIAEHLFSSGELAPRAPSGFGRWRR